MRVFLVSILWVVLILPVNAQQAGISVVSPVESGDFSWTIRDEEHIPLFHKEIFAAQDSIHFFLDYNKRFFLDISIGEDPVKDSVALKLYLDDQLIVLVNTDFGPGDRSVPFYTGGGRNRLRIIGGEDADITEFPWQVYMQSGNFLCGGSIISDRFILTAAHCTQDDLNNPIDKRFMLITAGATNPYDPNQGERYEVRNYFVYEGYNPSTFVGDLALLELEEPIGAEFAEVIDLIAPEDVDAGATDPGVMAWVSGWGLSSIDPRQFPQILQKVQLPIVSVDDYDNIWGNVPETFIMAGYHNQGKDACGGDSGGPLVVPVEGDYKLAGVVSWGSSLCNTYGGFVRVSSYLDWIEEIAGVGSIFRPQSPLGETLICTKGIKTSYQTGIFPQAQSYEWELLPVEAGTVIPANDSVNIDWNPEFDGMAKLRVRATRNDSVSAWSLLNIYLPENTAVVDQTTSGEFCEEEDISLNVLAKGEDLNYTWFRDGKQVYTGSKSQYFIDNSDPGNSGVYSCIINGICGTALSEEIDLVVHPTTDILTFSRTTRTYVGGSALLEVETEGHNLNYYWTRDEVPLEGENVPQLFITQANAEDIGRYRVSVEGTCGEDRSGLIYLYVSQDPGFTGSEENAILWPTVSRGEFFVALNSGSLYDIYLYDVSGNVAAIWKKNQYNTRFVKEGLSPGIYIAKMFAEGYTRSFKVYMH